MPKIESWANLPPRVRQHLIDRMHERLIGLGIEARGAEADWFKDFGSFKICGRGLYPKTFLLRGQSAIGEAL
jgi:hypothetical protein